MLLDFAKLRIKAFLEEIARLSESEFPYPSSQQALERLAEIFTAKLSRLEGLSPVSDPAVVKQECSLALRALVEYLPLTGFILRSTNIRNAFEVFGPFLRLAGNVLEPTVSFPSRSTKLLLSSEWEYSPFAFVTFQDLPEFLFIGLPAPESSNPLTIPVAGHELGHAVWLARDLGKQLEPRIKQAVVDAILARWAQFLKVFQLSVPTSALTTNLTIVALWSVAIELCLRQAEETFCDFMGARLFRQSYFHAFAYVVAPGGARRVAYYPSTPERIGNFAKAAARFGVPFSGTYSDLFQPDSMGPLTDADAFRVEVADAALDAVVDELLDRADQIVTDAHLNDPSDGEAARILARFRQVVPAEGCRTIVDIVNAAWTAFLDASLWKDVVTISARRNEVLKELVLKNFEVFEIEQIVSAP